MVININPNRINVSSGATGKTGTRKREEGPDNNNELIVPKRADVNFIPSPQSLQTLISSAVAALRRGIYWDRGTILNLQA